MSKMSVKNVETTTVSKKNIAKTSKKISAQGGEGKPVSLLARARAKHEENKRENSIWLNMVAGENVIAVIKGVGFREQEYKKGVSNVIDIKVEIDDQRIKTCNVPEFAGAAFEDILSLMEKYNLDPSVVHPVGIYANLKTYQWTATPDIPVVIRPSKPSATGAVWIGRIEEIQMEQKADLTEIAEEEMI